VVVLAVLALGAAMSPTGTASAQDVHADPKNISVDKPEYSPYLDIGYPQRVYFGDTHLHISYSTDAGMIGCRLGPEEAYRFARGEEVISSTGVRARLQRPLDFLVVADHAENLGLAPMIGLSGLRGALSIALMLSLPDTLAQRNILIDIVYGVVLVTLLGQGIGLRLLLPHWPQENAPSALLHT